MSDKPLNPTRDYYGEAVRIVEWINDRFFDGALPIPMLIVDSNMKHPGRLIEKDSWVSDKAVPVLSFKINPVFFKNATAQERCLELLRLMQLMAQDKDKKARNYHNRDFARAMWLHGLKTHNADNPDKETGDHVAFSVVPGMKFEKEFAKKTTGLELSWWIEEAAADEPAGDQMSGPDTPPRSKSGKRIKYACPVEGCKAVAWGKDSLNIGCLDHGQPVPLTITG